MASKTIYKKIGIVGAMAQEIAMLKKHVQNQVEKVINPFVTCSSGTLCDKEVVFAKSGIGMICAASTATILIEQFHVDCIIFSGVAGGLKDGQRIGDVIVAENVINYDFNCKNFKIPGREPFKRGEIPFLGLRLFHSDPRLMSLAMEAPIDCDFRRKIGTIASGSEFVDSARKAELDSVWEECESPDAVEMECAAIAQVCCTYDLPFLALRSLSDLRSGDCSEDFEEFCQHAADNLWPIVKHVVEHCDDE